MTIFLIIIVIVCILGIIYIINYNKMQYLKTKIEQSEGIIDDTLRDRFDLLVKADNIVKNVLKDNKEYFKEYINVKSDTITNFEMDRKLKNGFNLLLKFKGDYKELENNKDLKEIFINIKESDEKITAATEYYNKNTNELNGYIRKFPSNVVAKISHMEIKPFFDGKDMNDNVYNDFKI